MNKKIVRSEDAAPYVTGSKSATDDTPNPRTFWSDDEILECAAKILEKEMKKTQSRDAFLGTDVTKNWLSSKYFGIKSEVFGLILINTRHQYLNHHELFQGTIDGASVYPREVVRYVLEANAAAVILYHNHPSGDPTPSNADTNITRRLKAALDLIDVRVLDHLIIGTGTVYSFAEQGML